MSCPSVSNISLPPPSSAHTPISSHPHQHPYLFNQLPNGFNYVNFPIYHMNNFSFNYHHANNFNPHENHNENLNGKTIYFPGNNNEAQAFLSRGGQVIVRMRGLPYDCTAQQVVSFCVYYSMFCVCYYSIFCVCYFSIFCIYFSIFCTCFSMFCTCFSMFCVCYSMFFTVLFQQEKP